MSEGGPTQAQLYTVTQMVRPICMTKKLHQEVWQHFEVTPGLDFMEITKSALCEAYATVTDFEKLPFYYENWRLFPVIQYFRSIFFRYLIFQSIFQILH